MGTMKKALSLILVAAVSASAAIGGTLAYLTQEDAGSAENVFTVGNINVSLDETVNVIGSGGTVTEREGGADYKEIMPGDYLQKEVTVTNNGSNPAYVAVTVDVNNFNVIQKIIDGIGDDDENAEAMLDYIFDGWGMTVKDRLVNDVKDMSYKINEPVDEKILHVDSAKRIVASDVAHFSIQNWFKTEAEEKAASYTVAGASNGYYTDDMQDYSLRFTYYIDLGAGEEVTLFKGLNVPAEFDSDKMKMFDGLEIDVRASAIQADNINVADQYKSDAEYGVAKTAFALLAGDITEIPASATRVETAENLVEALEAGEGVLLTESVKIDPASMSNAYGTTGINVKNGQTIDGGGNTLDIKGAGGTWDSGINTTGGIIKNITVTGSFRGIFINHNSTYSERVVLENVTIEGTTYTISCDQGTNQGLTATDSTFKGWTSYAATLGDAKFVDCYFGEGNGYSFCRPYAPTEFVGCAFEAGFGMDPRAAVTFENCTLDGVALTADNLATLVTSNIANATVK